MYPAGGAAWRRLTFPVSGALFTGYLLSRYFPNARGSGIPQTKAALFLRDGFISFRTVVGKFFCCSVSLASGIALGREGPSVQVGSRSGIGLRPAAGTETGADAGAGAHRSFRGPGGGLQHARRGGPFHARGSDGRSPRAGAGFRRAEFGHLVDRAPPAARRRTVVSRPRLSTHPPRRVPLLCRLGGGRRPRFRLLRQAAAFHPPALSGSCPSGASGCSRPPAACWWA